MATPGGTPVNPPVHAGPGRIVLVFIDGIGLGSADPETNVFAAAAIPTLTTLLGGRRPLLAALDTDGRAVADGAVLVAADATLGLPGRPQSGTGQSTLLTGRNAAAIFGRHFGSWVPSALRPMLARDNLLARARSAGRTAAFANAHPPGVSLERRPSAPPLAAAAAGLLVRGAAELARGDALASSITNGRWRQALGDGRVPPIEPARAGQNLARIVAGAELTLFAHYDTDYVGHRGSRAEAVAAVERVDAFLGGLLDALAADALLVVASDHGNLEDLNAGHTLNPVPVIATGRGREAFAAHVRSIADVAPAIAGLLGLDPLPAP